MGRPTLFLSDLHLDDKRPGATELFLQFLDGPARAAAALYILGDLFEYWLGDDMATPLSGRVAEGLSRLSAAGVPCHFMHGNRDFLLGQTYARSAGISLLPEEVVVNLHGQPTLLLHGDQLCTDDTEYQSARREVRDPRWQERFLARSPADRTAFAQNARRQSRQHKQAASEQIMDVNAEAVEAAFERHGVERMIHGHTHRPAIHEVQLNNGPAQRIVLGDWYGETGSVLRASGETTRLETLRLPLA